MEANTTGSYRLLELMQLYTQTLRLDYTAVGQFALLSNFYWVLEVDVGAKMLIDANTGAGNRNTAVGSDALGSC